MRISRQIIVGIKLALIVATYGFIFYKIIYFKKSETSFIEQVSKLNTANILTLVIVFLLMFLNWGIEAIKWKNLVSHFQPISFIDSLKSVFSGTSVSLFTPNRIGEFGGRIFILKSEHRAKAIFASIVGSISQFTITLFIGIIATIFLYLFYTHGRFDLPVKEQKLVKLILIGLSVLSILSIYLCINTQILTWLIDRLSFLKKYKSYYSVFSSYSRKQLVKILFLSLLRYLVFYYQFYLTLWAFGIRLNPLTAMLIIPTIFLGITLTPRLIITEPAVRSIISLYIISPFIPWNSAGIVIATTLIWFINVAIPALIGSVIFSRYRL